MLTLSNQGSVYWQRHSRKGPGGRFTPEMSPEVRETVKRKLHRQGVRAVFSIEYESGGNKIEAVSKCVEYFNEVAQEILKTRGMPESR